MFTACLLVSYFLGIQNNVQVTVAARLIIFLCFAVGLARTLFEQRHLRIRRFTSPTLHVVRQKSMALRLGLLLLLVFPCVMSVLFPSWPTTVFNFEFLIIFPILLLAVPFYVRWIEGYMPEPEDAYFRLSQALTRKIPWVWQEQKQLILSWGVKIFFIPLMYSWLILAIESLLAFNWSLQPSIFIIGLFSFGLCIDLLLASAGYFFASRILGNEIKSTEKTWLGWLVCLICYPPLLEIFLIIKRQQDSFIWTDWLTPSTSLYWIWAFLIATTWLIYWLSTVSFGLRFSNLSWRGLVDGGPYRYTKHPAYISKNIYWWLHTVPFFGVSNSLDLTRNLLGLIFVSFVYYLRAKTEEQHLLVFNEYKEYYERINKNGIFSLNRYLSMWKN